MSKRMIVWVVVGAFLSMGISPSIFAQTSVTGPSGTAKVVVDSYLEFSMAIVKKMDADTGQTDPWNQGVDVSASPSFDFGTLRKVSNASGKFLYMRGQYYYYVLMMASTSGRKYRITESGSQLTGPTTIARESVLLIPEYQWKDQIVTGVDQGAPPSGVTLGSATTAVSSTPQLVYEDANAGVARIMRAVVGIGGPSSTDSYPSSYPGGWNGSTGQGTKYQYTSWVPIGEDQVAGTYTGSVTFTLTLI